MARFFGRNRQQAEPSAIGEQPPAEENPVIEEAVIDLPDRELMSLLPIAGSLSGIGNLAGPVPEVDQPPEA